MSTYRFANNAATTLGSAISPTATSITVASGTGAKYPQPGPGQYFTATLFSSPTGSPNEIVLVTSRNGDTMTVVRGQEGTTAQAWSVGDTFDNFITAGFLNQLVDAGSLQAQTGNYSTDTGTANAGVATILPTPQGGLGALIGVPVRVKKNGATNTGAYTLTITSVGAGNVLIGGQLCEGGEIVANEIFEVIYDGANFNLISNPGTIHGDRLTGNSVPNAALALMDALTLKGNLSGGTTTPYDVHLSDLVNALGLGQIQQNANGYYVFIGSLLLQFGYKGTTNATFNFPIPFPNGYCAIFASNANSMGRYVDAAWANILSNSQFFLATKASDDGHASGYSCCWLAIGD